MQKIVFLICFFSSICFSSAVFSKGKPLVLRPDNSLNPLLYIKVVPTKLPVEYPYGGYKTKKYYQSIYKKLLSRNPVEDAKLAIQQADYFRINSDVFPQSKRFFKTLKLPALAKLPPHMGMDIFDFQSPFISDFYYQGRMELEKKGDHTFDYYRQITNRYAYYWNRTVIHAFRQAYKQYRFSFSHKGGQVLKVEDRVVIDSRLSREAPIPRLINRKKNEKYYQQLNKLLRSRNPISDAKLMLKKRQERKIDNTFRISPIAFFINADKPHLSANYAIKSLKLPPLPVLHSRLRKKIPTYSFQGKMSNYKSYYANKSSSIALYNYEIATYYYAYLWNRTVINGLLKREKDVIVKPSNNYLITKWGKYEMFYHSLPLQLSQRVIKWNSNTVIKYYKNLYAELKKRNPINDARQVIKKGKLFLLSINGRPLSFPEALRLDKRQALGLSYHILQGMPRWQISKKQLAQKKVNPAILDTYKAQVEHYSYYWNRTMIQKIKWGK